MLTIRYQSRFKKDYKLAVKRRLELDRFADVVEQLKNQEPLPDACRDHSLVGDYSGCRECHITPDWLLVYDIDEDNDELILVRMGTHADLF